GASKDMCMQNHTAEPEGPYSSLAAQVRSKREASLQEERTLQTEGRSKREQVNLDEITKCCYCSGPVSAVSGCWVGHGRVAHGSCAWVANDVFFLALDEAYASDANKQ